jgi:hypothetical protein
MAESDLRSFSVDLAEWRENTVTVKVREAVDRLLDRDRDLLQSRYMAGNPASEAERLAYLRAEEIFADFFDCEAEDLIAVLEIET